MEVFWYHGYEAATLPELLDEMGISRQSLYDTYGDKRTLFLAAFERYLGMIDEELEYVEDTDATLDTVREYADGVARTMTSGEPRACMVLRTSIELARVDDEVHEIVTRFTRRLERAFGQAVENSIENGDVVTDKSPRSIARFLFNTIQGLSVLACTGTSRRTLKDVLDIAFGAIR